MVASLDGIVAKKDNTVSWLDGYADVYERGVTEESARAQQALNPIDCFVLGSRTYEHALELGWPYGETPTIVLTSRRLPCTKSSVAFYAGDLPKLVHEALAPRYGNVWLCGGAMLCQNFLKLDLVDEIRLMVAPILLGDGLRLFGDLFTEQRWNLTNVTAYKNGFVELSYRLPARELSS